MAGKKNANKPKPKPTRRKAKATKAETVEHRKIGIGDNSQLALPAPDDYAHHMKTIRGLKEKSATAASLLRHAKTSANKACSGLAASIEETLAIEREGDPIKLQKRLELLGIGLKQIGSTIEVTIFDSLAGDELELVYKRGHADGKAGRTADNKYPEGSDLHAEYARGWRHGTASNLGLTAEQADAADEQREAA